MEATKQPVAIARQRRIEQERGVSAWDLNGRDE